MSSWYEALNELIDKSIQEEKEKNTKISDEFLTAYGVGSGDFRSVSLDSLLPSSNEDEGAETKIESEDMVNHPSHYNTAFSVEVIYTIMEWVAGYKLPKVAYLIGSVLKYLARAPYKHESPLQDLKKARFYLDKAIEILEGKHEKSN